MSISPQNCCRAELPTRSPVDTARSSLSGSITEGGAPGMGDDVYL
jgi:hypothetical protein